MKITSTKQLSNYLKDVRKVQSLSQGKVAQHVGLKQDTISKFELSCDRTQVATLFKLLSALNLELNIQPKADSSRATPPKTAWQEEW